MDDSHSNYESPLASRYCSRAMRFNWSPQRKHELWRMLWTAVASAQQKIGVRFNGAPITEEMIKELSDNIKNIDWALAAQIEKETRHDVMAHAKTFAAACPTGGAIIHNGLTSCDITDNAELIQMRVGLTLVEDALAKVIARVGKFALANKSVATLGYTHLQSAQPTTVGKRATMWMQDLVMDLKRIRDLREWLPFRGLKGSTGTQNALRKMLGEATANVRFVENQVAATFGFEHVLRITGQTYTRKIDTRVIQALADLAGSIIKIGTDIRLLQSFHELEEPFEEKQIGSSAMAYKRNPMRSERACSLGRHLIALSVEASMTQMNQMLERTLDDSAGRRIYLAESFLTADAILTLMQNIFEGLVVYPKVITARLREEMPFMIIEDIIAAMVAAGADRNETHERVRQYSQEAQLSRMTGGGNQAGDLLLSLSMDEFFAPVRDLLNDLSDPITLTGRASEQVESYIGTEMFLLNQRYPDAAKGVAELKV